MAKTYAELAAQLEALQAKAELARKRESQVVIKQIKAMMAAAGLTTKDLEADAAHPTGSKPTLKSATVRRAPAKKTAVRHVKYEDDAGNAWSGFGPKPKWLVAGIASGKTLESFLAGPASASDATAVETSARAQTAAEAVQTPSSKPVKVAKKATRPASRFKYRDGSGNGWSGRGPQPQWLKAALEQGKTLQDLSA